MTNINATTKAIEFTSSIRDNVFTSTVFAKKIKFTPSTRDINANLENTVFADQNKTTPIQEQLNFMLNSRPQD